MQSFNYKIKDPYGVHARPAGLMAREAMKYSSTVMIEKGGAKADMKKLFEERKRVIKKINCTTSNIKIEIE